MSAYCFHNKLSVRKYCLYFTSKGDLVSDCIEEEDSYFLKKSYMYLLSFVR